MKHLSVICTIFILFCLVINTSQDIDTEEKSIEIDMVHITDIELFLLFEVLLYINNNNISIG